MESKKNNEANIEQFRFPIMLMSMLFIGGLVLASFSYTSSVERDFRGVAGDRAVEITFMEEVKPVVKPEEEPQLAVVLPPSEIIKIDSNTNKVPDPKIIVPILPDIKIGDDKVVVDLPVIDFPDVEALFPGGAAELQRWINSNVQYPQTSIEMNEQGRVYLSFVVETDGSLSNISIERGVSEDLDKEAKRVLRKMPNWEAGEVKGKKVRTRCRLPIIFTLE